jgi:GTP cyclohydrolase I
MTVVELRASRPDGVVAPDLEAAVAAAETLLAALGADTTTEHLRRTAERMVGSFVEMLRPAPFEVTEFDSGETRHGFVLVRDVPFAAMCAHHVLPFVGTATVGYLPGARLLGLSKLARLVEQQSRGFQVQEEVTCQIADGLGRLVPDHAGIGVLVDAEHLCMAVRGVKARGASTVIVAWRGGLEHDAVLRAEFLSLAGRRP